MKILPPTSYLHECFSYNLETGVLTWRRRPPKHFKSIATYNRWNGHYTGKVAGANQNRGYRHVGIDDSFWLMHRIIWKMMTGYDPTNTIDHKDGNKSNNRWDNLREATVSEQNWNSAIQGNSTTGRRGVSKSRKGKYRAYITVDGKQKWIGVFKTIEDAGNARDIVARELAGEFYWEDDKDY